MKSWLPIAFAVVLGLFTSCSKPESESTVDVSINVPSSVTILNTDKTMSFTIMFGKGPLKTDVFVLTESSGTTHDCAISSLTEKIVTIDIYSGIASGSYDVSLKRGSQVVKLGTMALTVNDPTSPVKPASGSTIYGQVSCGGTGVSGVVVSDGVLVTTTDADGIYQLASAKKFGYVFISVPSGYEAEKDGLFPTFWKSVNQSTSAAQREDFVLNKVDNENFTLYVLGDMHLAKRNNDLVQFRSIMKDWQSTISATSGPQYGLALGDMTWDAYWYCNNFMFTNYRAEMNNDIKGVAMLHTMGNHDNDPAGVGDFGKETKYRDDLCPSFFSYNIGKFHIIVLDNIDNTDVKACTFDSKGNVVDDYRSDFVCDITKEQMDWLAQDLKHVSKSTPIILSSHAPFYKPQTATTYYANLSSHTSGSAGTTQLRTALAGYKVHAFTGHTHNCFGYDAGDWYETNGGSVCGSWWWCGYLTDGISLSQDGTPSGYMVCTVKGTDMTWQYKSSGYDMSHQFRSYDMNNVKTVITPELGGSKSGWQNYVDRIQKFDDNVVLLNIWNYDSKWTVSVTENGKALDVTPVLSYDPLHMIAMTAKRYKSVDSPNFTTCNWNHFFTVKASSANSTLEISVTDRFGNKYTETMKRPKTFSTSAYK